MTHQDDPASPRPSRRGRVARFAARFAARPDAVALLGGVLLFLVGAQIALVHPLRASR